MGKRESEREKDMRMHISPEMHQISILIQDQNCNIREKAITYTIIVTLRSVMGMIANSSIYKLYTIHPDSMSSILVFASRN